MYIVNINAYYFLNYNKKSNTYINLNKNGILLFVGTQFAGNFTFLPYL